MFGLVYVHWILYVNTALVAMGMITYPAVSAYISNIASPEEQGAVQGMITGVRSLCNGLGPALFGVLFQVSRLCPPRRGRTQESWFSHPTQPPCDQLTWFTLVPDGHKQS